jgi:hypothetical protein
MIPTRDTDLLCNFQMPSEYIIYFEICMQKSEFGSKAQLLNEFKKHLFTNQRHAHVVIAF